MYNSGVVPFKAIETSYNAFKIKYSTVALMFPATYKMIINVGPRMWIWLANPLKNILSVMINYFNHISDQH